ncbi:MAG: helix-turn-helix domain-containing protein [Burkholderiales bacterium]
MRQLITSRLASMTRDEKSFFKAMGARIAELRKDSNITQVQLAETMEVSQQTVAAWEVGRRGVPVSVVPSLARALGTTVETLVGETPSPARRGPAPKLQQQIERITQLPKPQQRFVMQMLDTVLAQRGR